MCITILMHLECCQGGMRFIDWLLETKFHRVLPNMKQRHAEIDDGSWEMRSAGDILRYIESYQLHMLDRPHMYSANPESFEEKIHFIERLRAFILDSEEEWSDYLVNNGFGVATVSTRLSEQGINEFHVQYTEIAKHFRAYLLKQGRSTNPAELEG